MPGNGEPNNESEINHRREVTSFDFGTSTNEYPYCGLTIKSNCEEFKEIFLKRMKFQENNRFTLEE
jgi:hypothetical protein